MQELNRYKCYVLILVTVPPPPWGGGGCQDPPLGHLSTIPLSAVFLETKSPLHLAFSTYVHGHRLSVFYLKWAEVWTADVPHSLFIQHKSDQPLGAARNAMKYKKNNYLTPFILDLI